MVTTTARVMLALRRRPLNVSEKVCRILVSYRAP